MNRGVLSPLFVFFGVLCSQPPVDGLLAVVGDYPILHSEVLQQAQMQAARDGVDYLRRPVQFENIYTAVLDGMINQYVVLNNAEKDTNIVVSKEEVDRALDLQIDELILRAGSESELEDALGSPLRKIKIDYWEEIRKMLMIERFKLLFFGDISVSRKEVESFYNTFSDSLPLVPKQVRFSVIELPSVVSEKTKSDLLFSVNLVRDRLLGGEEFSLLAKDFSDDPGTAEIGGDLGFMARGSLVFEYEHAAFALEEGEISPPVLTEFGFHLIKLIKRVGEKIHTKHILFSLSPTEDDKNSVREKINSLYNMSNNDPGLFDSLALDCRESFNNLSGVYDNTDISSLPSFLRTVLDDMETHSVSSPFATDVGSYALVSLFESTPSIKPDLENSWALIENYSKAEKSNRFFNNWVRDNRLTTFIKIY